jgi:hypothetical protein
MTTDYDAIVRAASLILADKPDDLKFVMAEMDESALSLAIFAAKLMEGKHYGVNTGNPDIVQRCRLLARHIGASVEMIEEEAGRTRSLFGPPARQ